MSAPKLTTERQPWLLAVVVCAVLPSATLWLDGDLPAAWLWVCGVVAAAGILTGRWPHYGAVLATGYVAYLAGFASDWHPLRLTAALVSLGALAMCAKRRHQLFLLIGSILIPMAVIAAILGRSPEWQLEARRALLALTGLALGGVGALAMSLLGGESGSMRLRQIACGLVALTTMGAALRSDRPLSPNALPAWRLVSASLPGPTRADLQGPGRAPFFDRLDALRAAGIEEAEYVWVDIALQENADPELIRAACPRGRRSTDLGPEWQSAIDAGRLGCEATSHSPREGAEHLAVALANNHEHSPARIAALTRLRADLLAEAGGLDAAFPIYAAAATAGDPYALRDAARAIANDDRAVPADLINTPDPLIRTWFHPDTELPEAWDAWGLAMDFASLQPLRRIGIRPVGRGKIKAIHNQHPSFLAVTSHPYPHLAFRLDLPPPPGRRMPSEVRIRFRNRYGFQLTYVAGDQRVTFVCPPVPAPTPGVIYQAIRSAGCASRWGYALMKPTAVLDGIVDESFMQGEYDLMHFSIDRFAEDEDEDEEGGQTDESTDQ